MALNSLLFYQFFVYISPKIVGGHNWDFATFTPQLHGILDWNYKRHGLMDFFSISSDSYVLALTPKPPKVDNGLFVRWKLSQIYTDEVLGLVCFLKCTDND